MNLSLIKQYLPTHRQLAQVLGPLACASDCDDVGLSAAQVNAELRRPTWCKCQAQSDQVYYKELATGSHGWLCVHCFGITQVG